MTLLYRDSLISYLVIAFQDVHDESGFRMLATTKYRPNEFGVFYTGSLGSWMSITVPPKATSYETSFYCRNDCLDVS